MGEAHHERSQNQEPICVTGCAGRSWSPSESDLLALPEVMRMMESEGPWSLSGAVEQWAEVLNEEGAWVCSYSKRSSNLVYRRIIMNKPDLVEKWSCFIGERTYRENKWLSQRSLSKNSDPASPMLSETQKWPQFLVFSLYLVMFTPVTMPKRHGHWNRISGKYLATPLLSRMVLRMCLQELQILGHDSGSRGLEKQYQSKAPDLTSHPTELG